MEIVFNLKTYGGKKFFQNEQGVHFESLHPSLPWRKGQFILSRADGSQKSIALSDYDTPSDGYFLFEGQGYSTLNALLFKEGDKVAISLPDHSGFTFDLYYRESNSMLDAIPEYKNLAVSIIDRNEGRFFEFDYHGIKVSFNKLNALSFYQARGSVRGHLITNEIPVTIFNARSPGGMSDPILNLSKTFGQSAQRKSNDYQLYASDFNVGDRILLTSRSAFVPVLIQSLRYYARQQGPDDNVVKIELG